MDKETLSNYGWVVICVLVLVVMISLATPFGSYVATAVQNTTTALTDTADKQAEKAGGILDIINPAFEFNESGEDSGEAGGYQKKAPKDTVIKPVNQGEEGCDYTYAGQTVTFEDVEINTTENTGRVPGFAFTNATFKDCTINGFLTLYGDCTFIDCEFNVTGDNYNVWTWGAHNATFENCTFFCDGKAVYLYGGGPTKLTVNNCTFVDGDGLVDETKAAIEIGNDYGATYELIVNNAIVDGFAINTKGINTGTTLWGNKSSMGTDKLNVIVDGVDVY